MMLKKTKIAVRLTGSFITMILITALIGGVGIFSMMLMKSASADLFEKQVKPQPIISNIVMRVNDLMNVTQSFYLYNGNAMELMNYEPLARSKIEEYYGFVEQYEPFVGENAKVAFADATNLFKNEFEGMIWAALEKAKAGTAAVNSGDLSYMEADYKAMITNFTICVDDSITNAVKNNNANNTTATTATIVLFAIFIVGIITAIASGASITRAISKPITQMAKAADSLAKGKLNIAINITSEDEIGQLAHSIKTAADTLRLYVRDISTNLRAMADGDMARTIQQDYIGDFAPIKEALVTISEKLVKTLGNINIAADQVSVGAEQVSAGSQTLAQGATEQAGSIEQLSTSINEIAQKVQLNADQVTMASESVVLVSNGVEESNAQMQQMLASMKEISNASDEISDIMRVVDDIAFQTNILSLNAAIEAARAGAAGKGFAVVADEVRNLAHKSSESAKQTAKLIDKSMKAVAAGTKLANATAKSLTTVAERSKAVEDSIEVIDKSSLEQAHAISWITKGVEQISAVVQHNSATAEQSAAASVELSEQAQQLKTELKKFRLESGGEDAEYAAEYPEEADSQDFEVISEEEPVMKAKKKFAWPKINLIGIKDKVISLLRKIRRINKFTKINLVPVIEKEPVSVETPSDPPMQTIQPPQPTQPVQPLPPTDSEG